MTTEERLERLERELTLAKRNNRWLLAAAGIVVLMLVLARTFSWTENTAQAQGKGSKPKVVAANEFVLEDEMGRRRAVLEAHKGRALLAMMDENGKIRISLDALNSEPGLSLFGEEFDVRAMFGIQEKDPGLVLWDESNNPRFVLALDKKLGPTLKIMGEKGKPVWSAPR